MTNNPVTMLFSLRSTWKVTLDPFIFEHVVTIPSCAWLADVPPLAIGLCQTKPSDARLSVIKMLKIYTKNKIGK